MTSLAAVRGLVKPVCEAHGIDPLDLFHSRRKDCLEARQHLFYLAQRLDPPPSNVEIAETLGVCEASVRRLARKWRGRVELVSQAVPEPWELPPEPDV